MSYPKSLSSIKYPKFIRKNSILQSAKIQKVFPLIGLENFQQKIRASDIIADLTHKELANRIDSDFQDLINIVSNGYAYYLSSASIDELKILVQLYKKSVEIDLKQMGKIPVNINLGKLFPRFPEMRTKVLKRGTPLQVLLKWINRTVPPIKWDITFGGKAIYRSLTDNLMRIELLNRNLKKMQVVFCSQGEKAYWDIATMSMRGIKSCQAWSKSQAYALVGSILDPCAGLIYLTDGTNTKYGSKMLGRSVVRFISNKQTTQLNKVSINQKPTSLLLERAYSSEPPPGGWYGGSFFLDLFQKILQQKTSLPITTRSNGYAIPISKDVNELQEISGNKFLSYRDSNICYYGIADQAVGFRPFKSAKEIKSYFKV